MSPLLHQFHLVFKALQLEAFQSLRRTSDVTQRPHDVIGSQCVGQGRLPMISLVEDAWK